jgi:hypothetical protein
MELALKKYHLTYVGWMEKILMESLFLHKKQDQKAKMIHV